MHDIETNTIADFVEYPTKRYAYVVKWYSYPLPFNAVLFTSAKRALAFAKYLNVKYLIIARNNGKHYLDERYSDSRIDVFQHKDESNRVTFRCEVSKEIIYK